MYNLHILYEKRLCMYILLECEVFCKCPVYTCVYTSEFLNQHQGVLSSSRFFDQLLKMQSGHSFTGLKRFSDRYIWSTAPHPKLSKPIYKALIDASFSVVILISFSEIYIGTSYRFNLSNIR